jgi:uncharacterized protein YpmB
MQGRINQVPQIDRCILWNGISSRTGDKFLQKLQVDETQTVSTAIQTDKQEHLINQSDKSCKLRFTAIQFTTKP